MDSIEAAAIHLAREIVLRDGTALALAVADRDEAAISAESTILATAIARAIIAAPRPKPYSVDAIDPDPDERFLLWCPEQGGWHVGFQSEGKWLDAATACFTLQPTLFLPVPPDPEPA